MDQLVRHQHGKRAAQQPPDPVQHHVDGGGPARAGHPVTVRHVKRLFGLHPGVALAEARQALPVAGGAIVVEQPRLRQNEGRGVDRRQQHALARQPLHGGEHRSVDALLGLIARRDHRHVGPANVGEPARDRNRNIVRCRHRLPVGGDEAPGERVRARKTIGHTQRLQRTIERDHGELRNEQESDVISGHGGIRKVNGGKSQTSISGQP